MQIDAAADRQRELLERQLIADEKPEALTHFRGILDFITARQRTAIAKRFTVSEVMDTVTGQRLKITRVISPPPAPETVAEEPKPAPKKRRSPQTA